MKIRNVHIGMLVVIKKSVELFYSHKRVGLVSNILPNNSIEVSLLNAHKVVVPVNKLQRLK